MNVYRAAERKAEILVIEDSPTDAKLTKEALAMCGVPCRVHWVVDGVELLQYLRREGSHNDAQRPDLVLLDLKMPRKDGHSALRDIKTDEQLRMIPVVALTTSTAEDDIKLAYQLHANAYIIKPMEFDRFVCALRDALNFWVNVACLPTSAVKV